MDALKNLIREIHRRSIWQVMGVFLAASWGVIEVVDVLTEQVGLPDWTPTMALVLLLIGLPIVLATAIVQEGMPGEGGPEAPAPEAADGGAPEPAPSVSSESGPSQPSTVPPSTTRRLLTWRNAILGGVGAFALLGLSLMVYFAMWTSGIGPVGNLVAQGLLEEKDPVVLADFADDTGEGVGEVVTEALRVDLLESPVLSIVTAGQLSQALQLMGLEADTELTPALAREVAQRRGFKAFIRGEIAPAGSAYVLTAAVVSAESGDELKAFRVTARSNDDLVDAIDELSQDIREGVGESLRTIRAGPALEQATTSSFDALRSYTAAESAEERGDYDEALRLLEEAVKLDPAFAMAYRKMAVLYSNLGTDPARAREGARRAYEHRDRLTDRERYLTEAYYHDNVTGDVAAVEAAYRNALRVAPDDGSALNNLALLLRQRGDYQEAVELLERAVDGPGASAVASWNLVATRAQMGNAEGAEEAAEAYLEAYPGHLFVNLARVFVASVQGDLDGLHSLTREMERAPPGAFRWFAAQATGAHDMARGQWREGQAHMEESAVISEMDEQPPEAVARRFLSRVRVPVRVTGDTAGARAALRGLVAEFEALEGPGRPWVERVESHLAVGDVAGAREAYDRWSEELPEDDRPEGYELARRWTGARLLALEGDPASAARELEALRRELRCDVCFRWPLAETYVEMGRTREAIELLRAEQSSFSNVNLYALNQAVATKELGPLYEEVGDTAAALEQYRAVVERWADGDPEFQPVVAEARSRIAALGG